MNSSFFTKKVAYFFRSSGTNTPAEHSDEVFRLEFVKWGIDMGETEPLEITRFN